MFARAISFIFPLDRFPKGTALCFALCIAINCGGPQTEDTSRPEPKVLKKRQPEKNGVSEKGKHWSGWRWKGKRDHCFYVYKNKCFYNKDKACDACNKKKRSCKLKGTAPIKVTCKKR